MGTPNQPDIELGLHALITATDLQGHIIGQRVDHIERMYPIHCHMCGQFYPDVNLPVTIVTDIVTGGFTPGGAFVCCAPPETIPTDSQLDGG